MPSANKKSNVGKYFVATCLLLFGMAATIVVRHSAAVNEGRNLKEGAELMAAAIDAHDLRRLTGTPVDLQAADYAGLKAQLMKIRATEEDVRFVYLMGMRGGQVYFYVDSEPADSEDYSAPGDTYDEAPAGLREAFATQEATTEGPYKDRWGNWVSGFAPVTDPETGNLVAMLGVDISAKTWAQNIFSRELIPILVTVFFLVLFLIYHRYQTRRAEFIEAIEKQEHRLRVLYDIAAMSDVEGSKELQAALEAGKRELGLDIGIISKIVGDVYTVEQVISPGNKIKPGDIFSFKHMYCELTYKVNDVVGIEHAGESKYMAHACYKDFKLESYIGVPITVNGKNRGTLCFSAAAPREQKFSDADKDFLRMLGKWVSATLERKWDHERLKELDQMKSEFVSVASHQLRTPLTGIKWMAQLLLKGKAGEVKQEQLDLIKDINESNDRMIKLVEDLLNVSRIETGRKFEIVKEPKDVLVLLKSILQEHQPLAEKRKQKMALDVRAELPSYPLDEQKIRQVVGNLVSNALKYSPEGSTVEIALSVDKKKRPVVTVIDHGIGIPQAAQERIFQKFFRADNAVASETDGTGLGLYIAKSICEAHGGGLAFISAEGKGSTFTATF